jgi:hypothetical protein
MLTRAVVKNRKKKVIWNEKVNRKDDLEWDIKKEKSKGIKEGHLIGRKNEIIKQRNKK